jgi:hypothetical protein
VLHYVSRNYEFGRGLRMINIEPDHYPWPLLLRAGIAVSWWLTVAKSETIKQIAAASPVATSATSATA